MALTAVRNLQLHNQIERVLHVPGNYRGGILEMAIVVDRAYDRETARMLCADIITSCKRQSDVFRNVRLNMVLWGKDILLTPDKEKVYQVQDTGRLREALSPFLKQKLVLVYPEEMEAGTRFFVQAGINF
ncbi:MAG: hypothetical protein HFI58_04830 [Lachnospiraceae bacterium]|nr:hypothetical protein [Lachnospiraceae bacterium]